MKDLLFDIMKHRNFLQGCRAPILTPKDLAYQLLEEKNLWRRAQKNED